MTVKKAKAGRKAGRPRVPIDWDKVGKYLQAQCSAVGISGLLGISADTLYLRCKQDLNVDFTVFSAQKKAEGVELLRAKQYQTAMEGNVSMGIWLGKQYLQQRDKQELTGSEGKPLIPSIQIEIINSVSQVRKDDSGS